MIHPTMRQLRYFLALAEERHFSRAAERCNVTQPALSTQIRALEERLGVPLVDRRGHRLHLTPAGRELEMSARRILAELNRLEGRLGADRPLGGRLRLGSIPTIAPFLLPEAIGRLEAAAPELDLRLREGRTQELLRLLEQGELDAAVIALPVEAPPLETRVLAVDRFLLAGRAEEIAALAPPGSPPRATAIPADRLLLLEDGHCLGEQTLELCGVPRSRTRLDVGAASLETLTALAASGVGVTLLPELALSSLRIDHGGLALARLAPPEPARRIALVRPAALGPAQWFEELTDHLAAAAEACLFRAQAKAPSHPAHTL